MIGENSNIGVVLLDIPVKPGNLKKDFLPNVREEILSSLESRFGPFQKLFEQDISTQLQNSPKNVFQNLTLYLGNNGCTISFKTYGNRSLMSVTIEYDHSDFGGKSAFTYAELKELESDLAGTFETSKLIQATPEIKRGLTMPIYYSTSDDRIFEYDIEEILFDESSEFQHIQIVKTQNYGNTLILDGNINLSDSDLIYTETLMCKGKVDYKGKDILILGGGDGALLNELRKESPASITMVEIDEVVIKACRVFMRLGCSDSLDSYVKDEYEILIGDCIEFMKACKIDGKKFDVIFGDLTEIPISPTPQGEIFEFLHMILNLSLSILKDDGLFITHGNGASVPQALEMYENHVLGKLPVKFTKSEAIVPSFMEKWVFYCIQKQI